MSPLYRDRLTTRPALRNVVEFTVSQRDVLDYAAKLTTQATRVTPADIDGLRRVGFTDQAILQINLIACWFNYINRVADGLGVGREPA